MSYQEQLLSLASDLGTTGASFARRDGEELHVATAGVRNRATRDPVTTGTIMHIGSITKALNGPPAVAVLTATLAQRA